MFGSATGRCALRRRSTSPGTLRRGSPVGGSVRGIGSSSGSLRSCRAVRRRRPMIEIVETRRQAAREALFCEAVLAKSGDNVLLETLRGAPSVTAWTHYPPGDVYDRDSGAQWYYHCHSPAADAEEHGHFHCFVRPEGPKGPIHHLAAVGVDPFGKLIRLFTVNHWVVGDDWLPAEATIALLERFDVELARPSYLVNRWLTALFRLYRDELSELIRERDRTISAHVAAPGTEAHADHALEVTSERRLDLLATAQALDL